MSAVKFGFALVVMTALASGCAKSPERLVSEFMKGGSLSDRIDLVAEPDVVRSAMERHYNGVVEPPVDVRTETLTPAGEKPARVRATWKERSADGAMEAHSLLFFVVHDDNGHKIDWAASIGLNDVTLVQSAGTMPLGRFRHRGRLTGVEDQVAVLQRADRSSANIRGLTKPVRVRRQTSSTAYWFEDAAAGRSWRWTVVAGRGSALDKELAAAVSHGPVDVTLDLHVVDGVLVADRLVSATWVVPPDAAPTTQPPSPLHAARPNPDLDAWIFSLDPSDIILVKAAVLPVGNGAGLLVPCDGGSALWSGYALIASDLSGAGCAPRALSLRQARFLPPDEAVVAHVEVECLESGPTTSEGAPSSVSLADAAIHFGDRLDAVGAQQRLMDVQVKHLIADRSAYRGKTFITSMCCEETVLATYVAAGPFVELNRYAGQRHAMNCYLEWRASWDDARVSPEGVGASLVEVRVPADLAKQLTAPQATTAFAEDAVYCKRQVSGAFTFAGQVSWMGWPVFYLSTLHPPRPLLPGSGSTWSASQ